MPIVLDGKENKQSTCIDFAGKIHDFMYGQEENPPVTMQSNNHAISSEKEEMKWRIVQSWKKAIFLCAKHAVWNFRLPSLARAAPHPGRVGRLVGFPSCAATKK